MEIKIKIPTINEAYRLINEAERMNPGPWMQHSVYVAQAAEMIASYHPAIDPLTASIFGLLHDIGRREGRTDLRHLLDGYRYLSELGYEDAARICMTHSFPLKIARAGSGQWDGSPGELRFVEKYLSTIEYTEYDRLIQLCDALALPTGFCLIEKRLMDVAIRRGLNEYSIDKWKAFLTIQQDFERVIGRSIYSILPGVIENTFNSEILNQ